MKYNNQEILTIENGVIANNFTLQETIEKYFEQKSESLNNVCNISNVLSDSKSSEERCSFSQLGQIEENRFAKLETEFQVDFKNVDCTPYILHASEDQKNKVTIM